MMENDCINILITTIAHDSHNRTGKNSVSLSEVYLVSSRKYSTVENCPLSLSVLLPKFTTKKTLKFNYLEFIKVLVKLV